MSDTSLQDDTTRILPPDFALKKKLGDADLDKLLSSDVIAQAQDVITQSSSLLIDDARDDLRKLELVVADDQHGKRILHDLNAYSFSLKSKAALGGYDLVATIANSLHARVEQLGEANLTPNNFEIIRWHVTSMRQLIDMHVAGSGGPVGEAILSELAKLAETSC